jgi:hypothetical protein
MKTRPILFTGAMVRAILGDQYGLGRKRSTRRIVKPQPPHGVGRYSDDGGAGETDWVLLDADGEPMDAPLKPKLGIPGDRLWVKETWAAHDFGEFTGKISKMRVPGGLWLTQSDIIYRADQDANVSRWRPSIYMPKWASRLLLDITAVRLQRLSEMTAQDAIREGVRSLDEFRTLWDSLNAKRGLPFASDPWVWVYDFEPAMVQL